jgi:hypothetical protein
MVAASEVGAMISECLDCVVGTAHVAVPIEHVLRLVEYEVAATIPLAQPWIGGIGALGADLFLSVRLLRGAKGGRRDVKGLLLRERPGSIRWALEVDRVAGTEEIIVTPEFARPTGDGLPVGWLLEAERLEGDTIAWLDVDAVLATLTDAEGDPHPA